MSHAGTMNNRFPNAFLLSVLLHGLVVALLVFLGASLKDKVPETTKIFDLVAAAGDNYAATKAPALGSPQAVKVDFPQVPVIAPEPVPVEPAQPEPVQPSPVAPEPSPVKPAEVVKPQPAPKPVDYSKMVKRISDKRAANIKKKIEREQKAAEARAAKEAALNEKRMTKEEFDRLHRRGASSSSRPAPVKVARIDTAGIAGGVTGGSTANKTGGAGGRALTREQAALSEAYIELLKQRLHEAHQKPGGLSDLLEATVSFRLNSDGTMSDVRIVSSSGNPAFDDSVRAAFRRVRMPAPPSNLKTETYTLTFKMKDDQ